MKLPLNPSGRIVWIVVSSFCFGVANFAEHFVFQLLLISSCVIRRRVITWWMNHLFLWFIFYLRFYFIFLNGGSCVMKEWWYYVLFAWFMMVTKVCSQFSLQSFCENQNPSSWCLLTQQEKRQTHTPHNSPQKHPLVNWLCLYRSIGFLLLAQWVFAFLSLYFSSTRKLYLASANLACSFFFRVFLGFSLKIFFFLGQKYVQRAFAFLHTHKHK